MKHIEKHTKTNRQLMKTSSKPMKSYGKLRLLSMLLISAVARRRVWQREDFEFDRTRSLSGFGRPRNALKPRVAYPQPFSARGTRCAGNVAQVGPGSFKQILGFFKRAPGYFKQILGSFKRAPGSF